MCHGYLPMSNLRVEALLPAPVGAGRFVIRATHERGVGAPSSRSLATASHEAGTTVTRGTDNFGLLSSSAVRPGATGARSRYCSCVWSSRLFPGFPQTVLGVGDSGSAYFRIAVNRSRSEVACS